MLVLFNGSFNNYHHKFCLYPPLRQIITILHLFGAVNESETVLINILKECTIIKYIIQDAMAMLRNPTCEDSTVQYELRACGEESSEGNTCVQLQSEMMAIKQKMANQCGKITDPCANLEGMKKQKCKREQKNKKDGDNGENEKSGGGGGGRGGGGRGGGGRGGGGRGGGGQGGGRGGGLWKKP